jgi:signal transduction histidine kinase
MQYVLSAIVSALLTYLLVNRKLTRQFNEKKRELLSEAITAERTRIALELHDSTLQGLQAARMRLDRILLYNLRQEVVDDVSQAKREVIREIKGLRHIVYNTSTSHLLEQSLSAMLEEFFTSMDGLMGWKLHFENKTPEKEFLLDATTKQELYKIAQQTIQNSFSHGLGDTINITLVWTKDLVITIEDNGHGFIGTRKGLGQQTLKTRAKKIGAALTIRSGFRGVRTTITMDRPVPLLEDNRVAPLKSKPRTLQTRSTNLEQV